jgi:proline dehydrogenase
MRAVVADRYGPPDVLRLEDVPPPSPRCQDARMGLGRNVLFRVATSRRLERAVKRLPGGEPAAWRSASRYVASRSRSGALATVERLLEAGHGVSIDLFGERVSDAAVADQVRDDYVALAAALPPPPADVWLSVDLSHLAVGAGAASAAERLAAIADALPPGRRMQVGAEEAALTDVVHGCVHTVAAGGLADRLGATVQANLLRSPADADALADAGVHVRLVKGAYVEAAGAHPYGEPTDVAFLRLGFQLAARGAAWSMATHDGRLREALLLAHGPMPVEHLFGVRPEALDELRGRGVPTRVYVPYGADWFRYWMRRLAESRGA